MPPIDVRPAAHAQAERHWPDSVLGHRQLRSAYTAGAQWAVGKLPGREEIADAIRDRPTGQAAADAVLALIQKQYEET